MIKNERQYRITRAEADRFERALADLQAKSPHPDMPPALQKGEVNGLRSQLEDLRAQLEEYEALKAGTYTLLEVNSLEQLPRALVQVRIAAGLSQKDLADRLGIKEQQVQRYEATDYESASVSRLKDVCRALGLNIRKDLFLSTPTSSLRRFFARLQSFGIGKDLILSRFVPPTVAARAKVNPKAEANNIIFYATTAASHIYGWTPTLILGWEQLSVDRAILGAARFKVGVQSQERRLSAYTIYAHFLAVQLLEATAHLPLRPISIDPLEVRRLVLAQYGGITFENVLRYVWDLGVPVLPLNDPAAFHGATWRVNGRNVIVLKQKTQSLARWLHDLLHELRHAGESPEAREHTVIEAAETDQERLGSEEESRATEFAAEIVLDGRSEELVKMCVDATRRPGGRGRLELLKSELPKVAEREGVPTDYLANYMAFRLSSQGENWWGAAANLQRSGTDPWQVARDVLLTHTNLYRLRGMDRDLLTQALISSGA